MKVLITITTLIASAGLVLAAEEGKKPAEGTKAKPDAEAIFKKKDTNGDNKLSKEEFLGKQKDADKLAKAEKQFTNKDKDKDGSLSKEEFTAAGGKKKSS